MSWWQRFQTWLGFSEPAGVREQVEDWIEAHPGDMNQLHAQRDARGGYTQRRRQDKFFDDLPVGADFALDVFEAPVSREPLTTRFGYTLSFFATEADNKKWTLTIDPEIVADPVWVEVKSA